MKWSLLLVLGIVIGLSAGLVIAVATQRSVAAPEFASGARGWRRFSCAGRQLAPHPPIAKSPPRVWASGGGQCDVGGLTGANWHAIADGSFLSMHGKKHDSRALTVKASRLLPRRVHRRTLDAEMACYLLTTWFQKYK
jgi:hypothetical protein